MISNLRARRAFTLVELLIVILLIAILLAFVIPNFFGNREKAGDRVAQQSLKAAVTVVKSYATDTDNFTGLDAAKLKQIEPNLNVVAGTADPKKVGNSREISVGGISTDGERVYLTAEGENGACWLVQMNLGATSAGVSEPDRYYFLKTNTCPAANGDTLVAATSATKAPEGSQSFPARP